MELLSWGEIAIRSVTQLTPVWVALIITFFVSIRYKRSLGLYGKLFDSTVGMIGFALVMFWVYTGLFSTMFDLIATHDPLSQVSGMKNKVPGTPLRGAESGDYPYYLWGGDNLARDVFSRVMIGSGIVVMIAPLATLFAVYGWDHTGPSCGILWRASRFGFVLLGEPDPGLPCYFVVLPFGDTRNSYDRHAAIYGRCVVSASH
jgi:hypothetical protein